METKTCCVTGHRDIPKEYLDYVEQELRREVQAAIEDMLATDGPFLLEACVVEEGNVLPMTPPGGAVNQMLLEC